MSVKTSHSIYESIDNVKLFLIHSYVLFGCLNNIVFCLTWTRIYSGEKNITYFNKHAIFFWYWFDYVFSDLLFTELGPIPPSP